MSSRGKVIRSGTSSNKKQAPYSINSIKCYKRTGSDWYPSYALEGWYKGVEHPMLVEVSLIKYIGTYEGSTSKVTARVCVWGADDYGLEMDFEGTRSYNHAKVIWEQVLAQPSVNPKYLKDLGFITA